MCRAGRNLDAKNLLSWNLAAFETPVDVAERSGLRCPEEMLLPLLTGLCFDVDHASFGPVQLLGQSVIFTVPTFWMNLRSPETHVQVTCLFNQDTV